MKSHPKISIVTVTLNCVEESLKTAQSVLAQDFNSYEYIVKDGGSTDGTIEQLRNLGIPVIVHPDSGIYDAMNQAIENCRGEYICFLNTGDTFSDSNVLDAVFRELMLHKKPDFAFGDIRSFVKNPHIQYESREISYPNRITRQYLYRKMVCHQAWFVKRKILLRKGGFNLKYRLSADYDLLLNLVSDLSITQSHIPLVTVIYKGGGVTDIHQNVVNMENEAIIQKNYHATELLLYSLQKWGLKMIKPWVYKLYPYFPAWLKAKANGW